ncbi:hypothetical protein [Saccharibacillus qingshengii]|uniref:hypothetical protein n=1 Tax=Saccharibacillus qingshengii TaxID=1763540 RepID=UPI00155446A4|nr:hypothetical protein [Saccharibacillus qingshengii]
MPAKSLENKGGVRCRRASALPESGQKMAQFGSEEQNSPLVEHPGIGMLVPVKYTLFLSLMQLFMKTEDAHFKLLLQRGTNAWTLRLLSELSPDLPL